MLTILKEDSTAGMIEKLSDLLHHPHRHGTDRLHLASLVLIESLPSTMEISSISDISSSSWSDALNSRILYPISLTQAFLPLLLSESVAEDIQQPTTLVVVTPSNISSINAPHHAKESVTMAALTSYISTLRAELPRSIEVTHIRLGSITTQSAPSSRLDVALARVKRFAPTASSSPKSTSPSRNSPKLDEFSTLTSGLHKLHHGVFDAVVGRTHGTVFLGRGALLYAMIGAFIPSTFVGRMMGFHRNFVGDEQKSLG